MLFREPGPWGPGIGRNLAAVEVDGNFWETMGRLLNLEQNPPQANGIANITGSGGSIVITLQDGTVYGPFTMPMATFTWRGPWTPDVQFNALDIVEANSGIYLVLVAHYSPASFDPAFTYNGQQVYRLLWGTIGFVREWTLQTLYLENAQAYSYFRCTNALGCAVQLPSSSEAYIIDGAEFSFRQCTDSPVTFTSNGTINGMDGYSNQTGGIGAVVTAKKVGFLEWDLFGLLDPTASV